LNEPDLFFSDDNSRPILLSLGANLGDRIGTILLAIDFIKDIGVLKDIKLSSFYETQPIGYKEQPNFINIAIFGYTNLPINLLLFFCKSIEYFCGRQPRKLWHEREIDIDIIFYSNEIINNSLIKIPHPRMHERAFVLIPAAEIAPDYIHPIENKTISDLLIICNDFSEVTKYITEK